MPLVLPITSLADLTDSAIAVPCNFMCGLSDIKARLAEGGAAHFESIAPSAEAHARFLENGGIVLVARTSDLPDPIPDVSLIPLMRTEGISIPVSLILPRKDLSRTPLPILAQYLADSSKALAERFN